MPLSARLDRVQRRVRERPGPTQPVEIWLPYKGGGDPPGRYPAPGGRCVLIVYVPEAVEPERNET